MKLNSLLTDQREEKNIKFFFKDMIFLDSETSFGY